MERKLPIGRSRQKWLVLFLCSLLVSGYWLWQRQSTWRGGFIASLSAVEPVAVILTPLAAGIGTWLGASGGRSGFPAWRRVQPRPQGRQILAEAWFGASAIGAAFLALITTVMILSLARGATPIAQAWPLGLAIPVILLALFVWSAVGVLLGRVLPLVAAMAVAVLVPYGAFVFIAFYGSENGLSTLGIYPGYSFTDAVPDAGSQLVRLVFWGALAAFFIGRLGAHRSLTHAGRGITALAVIVAFAVGPPVARPIPEETQMMCMGTKPTVCTLAAYRVVFPEFLSLAQQASSELPQGLRPTLFSAYDVPFPPGGRIMRVGAVGANMSEAFDVDPARFFAMVGSYAFSETCGPNATPVAPPSVGLVLWWRTAHGLPTESEVYAGDAVPSMVYADTRRATALANQLTAMTPAARQAWFRENLSDVLACKWPTE